VNTYAKRHGYRHEWIDASGITDVPPMRWLYRYEVLFNTLRRAAAGELVLLLGEDVAIVEPVALDELMAGRDWLLVSTALHSPAQINVQIWRNTAAARQIADVLLRPIRR
jgi:hypothetical protein